MILKYLTYKLNSWTIGAIKEAIEYFKKEGVIESIFSRNGEPRPVWVEVVVRILLIPALFGRALYILYRLLADAVRIDYNQFKEDHK